MPLVELHDFLGMINARDGLYGQISLFLYQSAMFAATAFVDVKYLKDAGYTSRKAARREFFYKARVRTLFMILYTVINISSFYTTSITRATVSSSYRDFY